jgi:hypothetical protein
MSSMNSRSLPPVTLNGVWYYSDRQYAQSAFSHTTQGCHRCALERQSAANLRHELNTAQLRHADEIALLNEQLEQQRQVTVDLQAIVAQGKKCFRRKRAKHREFVEASHQVLRKVRLRDISAISVETPADYYH